ncbi:hypothetical protein [Halocatena salina]|uniref:Uncharacterized protein n=1 Tax=Halocatena salina TaxID=2934340 RepID=A0A8U0A858_9EURY|nr:hypothetical protein [Halocatena salina]UPM44223.1 hypothetical protein MW046_14505 [Halocatena salina]
MTNETQFSTRVIVTQTPRGRVDHKLAAIIPASHSFLNGGLAIATRALAAIRRLRYGTEWRRLMTS